MTRTGFWLNVALATLGVVAFAALAGLFGYKWLAHDEPDRSHACGTGSRGGVCLEGETTNMVLTFVFGGVALTGIVLCARVARSARTADRVTRGSR
ncbi:hypothetical protein [Mycobacterium sp. 1423905.2]|uniref:hypothetical protein n=1 Tax=Mycobacterium sp. 1423905.2 TaxID=1856859 RepID=UPI0007FF9804|nr:hypothetical protein [Mycobacterium sp. 1423905.2]OBJ48418.1 hypothetical protein A9W95_04555 [Mycobacterium sp. 1423905.2]